MQTQAGSLVLALTAGASAGGSWCGVVGMPDFGVLAAAAMGCDIAQLLLVDEPGERWPEVVATLVEAVDVVVVRPPARPPPGVVRRLTALVRKFRSCLLVVGPWDGAMLRVWVASSLWTGVDQGYGHLRGRRVKVIAEGRGAGGRARSAWLWLPGPDGAVSPAELVQVGGPGKEPAAPSERILTGVRAIPTTQQPPVDTATTTAGVA